MNNNDLQFHQCFFSSLLSPYINCTFIWSWVNCWIWICSNIWSAVSASVQCFIKGNNLLGTKLTRHRIFDVTFDKNKIWSCGFRRWKEEIKTHRNIYHSFFKYVFWGFLNQLSKKGSGKIVFIKKKKVLFFIGLLEKSAYSFKQNAYNS